MIYPSELELKLRRFERNLVGFLVDNEKWAFIPVLLIAVALSYLTKLKIQDLIYTAGNIVENGQYFTARVARFSFFVLILISGISYFVQPRFRKFFNFTVMLVVWALNCYVLFYSRLELDTFLVIFYGVPATLIAAYFILAYSDQRSVCFKLMLGFSAICLAVYIYLFLKLYHVQKHAPLDTFLRLKIHYILFLAWSLYFASRHMKIDRQMILSPVNITKAVLWPPDTRLETESSKRAKTLWWSGIINVVLGFFLIQIRFLWNEVFFEFQDIQVAKAFIGFTLAVLVDIGIFNIIVGIARLFSFDARDATNFVWLSRSPADYWRRGSIYHYEFIQRMIFVPLLKFTRNPFLVTFAAFFAFYMMKNGGLNTVEFIAVRLGLAPKPDHLAMGSQLFKLIHFLLQFTLLWISQKWWFAQRRRNGVWNSWFAILTTYIANAGIVYLGYKILFLMRM